MKYVSLDNAAEYSSLRLTMEELSTAGTPPFLGVLCVSVAKMLLARVGPAYFTAVATKQSKSNAEVSRPVGAVADGLSAFGPCADFLAGAGTGPAIRR